MPTLYRTYRPKTFDAVVGQQHIVTILQNAVRYNRIGHAYLFTGPRGTGKTSIARLFATAVNCMPRDGFTPASERVCAALKAGTCIDLIEIDAASYTGVDTIRDLRESVTVPPLEAHYKIYIIDEAHMLTGAAANALLKTLEEPPAHTIFILATTALEKIPDTIRSRCQHFTFKRLSTEEIVGKLRTIADTEKIAIAHDALLLIAQIADGALRDAESLLGQVMALEDTTITADEAARILGVAPLSEVASIGDAVVHNDLPTAIHTVERLVDCGYDAQTLTQSLLTLFRHILLIHIDETLARSFRALYADELFARLVSYAHQITRARLITILDALANALRDDASLIEQLPLEKALVRAIDASAPPASRDNTLPPLSTADTQRIATALKQPTPSPTLQPAAPHVSPTLSQRGDHSHIAPSPTAAARRKNPPGSTPPKNLQHAWSAVIGTVTQQNTALGTLLEQCTPTAMDTTSITLTVPSALHKQALNTAEHRLTVESALATILTVNLSLKIEVSERKQAADSPVREKASLHAKDSQRHSTHHAAVPRAAVRTGASKHDSPADPSSPLIAQILAMTGGAVVENPE